MLHCFKCGADLPDNLAYCLHCGARLDDEIQTVVVPTPVVTPDNVQPILPQPKSGSGAAKFILGGLIGAGVVIVFLVVMGIILFSRQSDQQKNAVNANNAAAKLTQTAT